MAYQAFYRKWRPKTFDGVFGQEFITRTLKNEVAEGKLSHAYLFCGSRGTGKTTCAKILAKAVNCENPQNGNPCLVCENCRAIDAESALDVVEMDAASNTGVDDVRTLRESAAYTPASCKFRVYIIDEVHMLSKSAFNALLKILEEPPAHVIFILATTDPEAIPVTVLSRCQRFDFKRLSSEEILSCLQLVCQKEGLLLEESAGRMIAHLADGGMRDALSILDQCAGVSKEIDDSVVSQVTRAVGRGPAEELSLLLAQKKLAEALALLSRLHSESKNLLQVTRSLISLFRLAMLYQVDPTCAALRETLEDERATAAKLAALITQTEFFSFLRTLQDCYVRQCHTDDQKLELEMSFIQLTDPRRQSDTEHLMIRLEKIEQMLQSGVSPAPLQAEISPIEQLQPDVSKTPIQMPTQPKETETVRLPLAEEEDWMPAEEPVFEEEVSPVLPPISDAKEKETKPAVSASAAEVIPVSTAEILDAIPDPMLSSMLTGVRFSLQGDLLLTDPGDLSFTSSLLGIEKNRKELEKAAARCLGKAVRLKVIESKKESGANKERLAKCLEMAKNSGIQVENS
ncbi:MAG: DNA polymerase III subunit gamma/tau [Oscillospiraceae bacterium]|nr:DNA polymerase III subunit gamma/tau [Oscillospiraceae bacterium]